MHESPRPSHRTGPIHGDMATVVLGLSRRLRLPALTTRHSSTAVLGLFAFVNGVLAIGILARVPHPPAGATTLIVSLGILREPWQLGVLMVAVFLLVVQGFAINRLAGLDYPVWSPRPP